MPAEKVQTVKQLGPTGYASNPIHCLRMLHMLSIVTGRGLRWLVVPATLEELQCLLQLIQVLINAILSTIDELW